MNRETKIAFRICRKLLARGNDGTFVGDGKLTNYETKDDSSILRQLSDGEYESIIYHKGKSRGRSKIEDKWKGHDEHIVDR